MTFDVIVVGGGHAGCEAAAAAARMGARTALITHSFETIGEMSCNPAIGGLGKGHLVREIDALDGLMGKVADAAGIQFRLLNRSRGPAVQGPRAQADRKLYRLAMQQAIREQPGLTVIEASVEDLIVDGAGRVAGVRTVGSKPSVWGGSSAGPSIDPSVDASVAACVRQDEYKAGAVVLTTGTFLRGVIHMGEVQTPAGRFGEAPVMHLSGRLEGLALRLGRLKTGTPARLLASSIDWACLEEQAGDDPPVPFSFLTSSISNRQVSCHITTTTRETHDIIRANLQRAPMYSGQISSVGPRYCPSIEDKVVRFGDRQGHQIFLEPEGLDDDTVYPNGVSTSLPAEVQAAFLRTMPGLANVVIKRPGYAIEYDHIDPRELYSTLQVKVLPGLFMAGQINGTTGYEEAGAQGILAGINAARVAGGGEGVTISRTEAYLGVMVDDLVSRGVSEPYRMFTSRAEFRLKLRADNADQRLTPLGIELGCVGNDRAGLFSNKSVALANGRALLERLTLTPTEAAAKGLEVNRDGRRRSAFELMAYPGIDLARLGAIWPELHELQSKIGMQLEVDAKYAAYVERQSADVEALKRDEAVRLPADLEFSRISGLSNELRQKLERLRPSTLAQAAAIDGITPAALLLLRAHAKRAVRSTTA